MNTVFTSFPPLPCPPPTSPMSPTPSSIHDKKEIVYKMISIILEK